MEKIKRWIPLLVILLLMGILYLSGLLEYFTFENLRAHRIEILAFVEKRSFLAALLFIFFYILSTSLSLPIGSFLSVVGGFLFSQPLSTFYVVIGATIGASIIFLSAKTALGDFFRRKAGSRMEKFEKAFRKNGVGYLLFLRLVPIFPFWLVNLLPAFVGVSLLTFAWTTFLGIIPGAFVFTQAGAGLGAILDSGETFSIDAVLNWHVKVAFIALGFFALIPVLLQKIRGRT